MSRIFICNEYNKGQFQLRYPWLIIDLLHCIDGCTPSNSVFVELLGIYSSTKIFSLVKLFWTDLMQWFWETGKALLNSNAKNLWIYNLSRAREKQLFAPGIKSMVLLFIHNPDSW